MSLVRRKIRFDNSHYFQADIAAQQPGLPGKRLKLLFFFATLKLSNKTIVPKNRNANE